jgi:leucyl/phenylalanyl-tRNA--protein transferase
MQLVLTPELLLEAYRHGLFPMAYSGGSPYIHWICPEMRGQLSIAEIHIPRRLKKTIRSEPFEIRIDTAFRDVISACARQTEKRRETWINEPIIKAFCTLHAQGHAHSVECWQDDALVGGVYGLEIGGAFFGESMFSTARDASKIALIHLVARLWKGGFSVLDTQFTNDHLKQFGVFELPHKIYMKQLERAVSVQADFTLRDHSPAEIMADYLAMREKMAQRDTPIED